MSSSVPTVMLFDIDGTLIDGAGAGRAAMFAAFAEVVGSAEPLESVVFAGNTDRGIVRHGLEAAGQHSDPSSVIDAVLEAYLARLPTCIAQTPDYRLLGGVVDLLDRLEGRDGLALGLGTGNLESGAQMKLGPLGLSRRFAFGGFGSDDEDRTRLLAVGAARGASRLGRSMDACRIVVIGDTPRDISAGRAIGAEVLAVATGRYTAAELAQHPATWVVDHLEDPQVWPALVPSSAG